MAKYETMLVTSSALDEEASAALIGKFKSLIEANGTIDSVEDFPAELDRNYRITEGVLRSIIVAEEA